MKFFDFAASVQKTIDENIEANTDLLEIVDLVVYMFSFYIPNINITRSQAERLVIKGVRRSWLGVDRARLQEHSRMGSLLISEYERVG